MKQTMSQEQKILRAVLKRVEHPRRPWLAGPWPGPLLWLAMLGGSWLLFRHAEALGHFWLVVLAALMGAVAAVVLFRIGGAKAWPHVAPHVDKQSVLDRLAALQGRE